MMKRTEEKTQENMIWELELVIYLFLALSAIVALEVKTFWLLL
jgi:hypothetical protein